MVQNKVKYSFSRKLIHNTTGCKYTYINDLWFFLKSWNLDLNSTLKSLNSVAYLLHSNIQI
jgi:hypothetical protein